MFDAPKFGMHLAYLRRFRRLSVRTLADTIGVSAASISRIERGNKPDIDSFSKIVLWAGWEKECHNFFNLETVNDGNGQANS